MCSELPPGEALPSPNLGLRCLKPCPSFLTPQISLDSLLSGEIICARANYFIVSFSPRGHGLLPAAGISFCRNCHLLLATRKPGWHLSLWHLLKSSPWAHSAQGALRSLARPGVAFHVLKWPKLQFCFSWEGPGEGVGEGGAGGWSPRESPALSCHSAQGLGERQCLQRVLSGEYLKVFVPFLGRGCVPLGSKIVP